MGRCNAYRGKIQVKKNILTFGCHWCKTSSHFYPQIQKSTCYPSKTFFPNRCPQVMQQCVLLSKFPLFDRVFFEESNVCSMYCHWTSHHVNVLNQSPGQKILKRSMIFVVWDSLVPCKIVCCVLVASKISSSRFWRFIGFQDFVRLSCLCPIADLSTFNGFCRPSL